MTNRPHDARAVANLILDRADAFGTPVSNLALQKLLYFAHGVFLVRHRRPLVAGEFVAWKRGPVHPPVYEAFKVAGMADINFRATAFDYAQGAVRDLPPPQDEETVRAVNEVVGNLGRLPALQLVAMSHVKGGPWDVVVNKVETGAGLGLRIRDSLLVERFRRHWLAVDFDAQPGGPIEDAPFA